MTSVECVTVLGGGGKGTEEWNTFKDEIHLNGLNFMKQYFKFPETVYRQNWIEFHVDKSF